MDGKGHCLYDLQKVRLLEIPFFQRAYVWDDIDFYGLVESCEETVGGKMPFFGSLILKYVKENDDDENGKHYLVIDGQQRITTFNVLIRAILDIVYKDIDETDGKTYGYKSTNMMLLNFTMVLYITGSDENMNNTYKLRLEPADVDSKAFTTVMGTDYKEKLKNIEEFKKQDSHNKIIHAYEFFYDLLSKSENVDRLKDICKRLNNQANSLIWIILDDGDDEQKIFNSVNSLGKNLTSADIIKNNLFQKLKEKAEDKFNRDDYVKKLYNDCWNEIFDDTVEKRDFWYSSLTVGRISTNNLELFLKDYAIIRDWYKAKETGGASGLNKTYSDHIRLMTLEELVELLKDISSYAKTYYEYKQNYLQNSSFTWDDYQNRLLLILDCMETTTFDPYILKVIKEDASDVKDKLFRLERFFLQRFIYNARNKNYNQCCERLIVSTRNDNDADEAFFASYMKESPAQNNSYKPIFRSLSNKQGRLFIFLIEMLLRKEKGEDNYSDDLTIGKFSLEHIMPRKWHENWMDVECFDEYGNLVDRNDTVKFRETRDQAVGSLGNFALLTTTLNAKIGNSSFDTKINGNGKPKEYGIVHYCGSLGIASEIIDVYKADKLWNEKKIFEHEKKYFEMLNDFYEFE